MHNIWTLMHQRCGNPNNGKYRYYGARGIRVCDAWDDFAVFRDWAISAGYGGDLTIERKDVDEGYSPENCTWIPARDQAVNRRNVLRAPDGELWVHKARRNGVIDAAFRRRVFDGWPLHEAASQPMNVRRIPRQRDESGRYA